MKVQPIVAQVGCINLQPIPLRQTLFPRHVRTGIFLLKDDGIILATSPQCDVYRSCVKCSWFISHRFLALEPLFQAGNQLNVSLGGTGNFDRGVKRSFVEYLLTALGRALKQVNGEPCPLNMLPNIHRVLSYKAKDEVLRRPTIAPRVD